MTDIHKTVSPYVDKEIPFEGYLRANQLDNNNYLNLKKNLIKEHQGKCFQNHGYIVKIGNIPDSTSTDLSMPIAKENLEPVIKVQINANCKLCLPLIGSYIIGRVASINKMMLMFINGPINGIISLEREKINNKNFKNTNDTIRYIKNDEDGNLKLKAIKNGDYIKVNIDQIKMTEGKINILTLGTLDSMATQDDIELFERDELFLPEKLKNA